MLQFTFERGLLPLNEKSPFAELFQLPPRNTRRHDFLGTSPAVYLFCCPDPTAEYIAEFREHRSPLSVSSRTDQLIFWLHGQIYETSEHFELVINLSLIRALAFESGVSQNTQS